MGGKSSKHEPGALSPAAPGSKVLRAPVSAPSAPKRVLFKDSKAKDEEKTPSTPSTPTIPASSTQNIAVADICTAESTKRAEELKLLEDKDKEESSDGLSRFEKYRNFFKNHETELARDVQKLVTKANKSELQAWVAENVGELKSLDNYGKVELVELAMVSAAIAKHGEKKLRKMDKRGELATLPNMPLHTHDLRMESKQQACRNASKAARKDEMQAAHYVGLEVMMTLNARLPVQSRVGDELREILNDPSNLRLVLASSNQSLHKKADTLLMIDYDSIETEDDKKGKSKRNCPTSQEYARLVQVAKQAQSDAFQDAMKAAGAVELYCSLRDQFFRLDVGGRAVIWDITKDKIVPRGRSVPSAVVIQVETKTAVKKTVNKEDKPKSRASRSRSPSPAVIVEKIVEKTTAILHTRGVATAADAKFEPKKPKAGKTAASKPTVASKAPTATATKKPSEKPKKTKKKAADSPPKDKENRAQKNKTTTTKRPTTRRVTRSKGTSELAELPDNYSDGSEYVDESDSDYED